MMKVVCNPSMQMEKFDRPMYDVNCYDNALTDVDKMFQGCVRDGNKVSD